MPVGGAVYAVVMNDRKPLVSRKHHVQLDAVGAFFKREAKCSHRVFRRIGRIATVGDDQRR